MIEHHWLDFDGWCAAHGVDPVASTPDRSVALIWHFFTRNMDAKSRHKFETTVWRPPPGQVGKGVWSADNETRLFAAAKAAVEG